MKLLPFGRAAKPTTPTPAPALEPSTSTSGGIVLVDDTDLTRYQNNYQLYDTGPRTGTNAFVVELHSGTTPPAFTTARPKPLPVPIKKPDSLHYSEHVVMMDTSGQGLYDTPIICESDSTRDTTEFNDLRRASMSSIDVVPIPQNAIRRGGPPKLFGTQYMGLLYDWLIIGFVEGGSQTLVEPLFRHYLHMTMFQLHAVGTLLNFAWFFKIVAAVVSDTWSISYQRRKPYIYIGWTLFSLCMLVLVCIPQAAPYRSNDGDDVNEQAAAQGARYIPLLMLASLGHLLATVACEGMVVEIAQREGEYVRGRTQCIVVTIQLLGRALGTVTVSLGFNSASFGGSFGGSMPLPALFALFGFLAIVGIFMTWFVIVDEDQWPSTQTFKQQLRRLGHIAQRPPVWKLMLFSFLCSSALACDVLESNDVYTTWLHARPLHLNLSSAVNAAMTALASFLVYKAWINTNWRWMVCGCLALSLIVALPIDLLTFFDVWRNLVFVFAKDAMVSAFSGVILLIQLLVVVEVAQPGFEASTYGLVSTASFLAKPFVGIITRVLMSLAGLQQQDLAVDSSDVRSHLATELVVKTSCCIALILVASPLVPRQKKHARELNSLRPNERVLGLVVLSALLVAFVMVLVSSFLRLFESTSCLAFAGGGGCG